MNKLYSQPLFEVQWWQ